MGYSIEDLKRAGIINGEDALIVQQSGITKQIARSIIDQAVVITEAGAQSTGVIRKEGTYVLQNNSAEIRLSVQNAIGKALSDESTYTDSASAAAGWIIKILNNSTRNHTVIYGANSWTITAGEIQEYYWTGSAWTFHNIVTEKKLNDVLAGQETYNIVQKTQGNVNYNDLIPEENLKTQTYFVYGNSNKPNINAPNNENTVNYIVFSMKAGAGGAIRGRQIAYHSEDLVKSYSRVMKTNGMWNPWEKLTSESDVNTSITNALTDYVPKSDPYYKNSIGYSMTDANEFYPESGYVFDVGSFNSNATNTPDANYYTIMVFRNRQSSTSTRLVQLAICSSNAKIWTRYASVTSTSPVPSWSSWKQFATI